jgi:uncharacterized membrane protein YkvA (DUF1232 family)
LVQVLSLMVVVGGLIVITFLVLLSLPQCTLKTMIQPFVSWGFVALCAAYAISPVDVMPEIVLGPFGLFDDVAAVVAGIGTAAAAINAAKKKALHNDPSLN